MDINWNVIREIRDQLLKNSDWTQLVDAELTDEKKELWKEYRKSLRNVPSSFRSPRDVEWPQVPKNE
jgi:hypothetical protein